MVFSNGLGHGIDTILEHIQLPLHWPPDPGVQATFPYLVDGSDHAIDRVDDDIDQIKTKIGTDDKTYDDHQQGNGGVPILDKQRPVGVDLDGDITHHREIPVPLDHGFRKFGFRQDRGAQNDVVVLEFDGG